MRNDQGGAKVSVRKSLPAAWQRLGREIISWTWAVLAFLLIEGTVAQARVIPSGSMENTVLVGDHLLVNLVGYDAGIPFTRYHLPLWREPERQQVVVFHGPPPLKDDLIKRVIGVPGDRIRISGDRVYVNDALLTEPYVLRHTHPTWQTLSNFPQEEGSLWSQMATERWASELPAHIAGRELVVPQGMYFVMGDNRDNSYDSRYWGFVPRENIIGTPLFIYMSIDAQREVWEPGHIQERVKTYLAAMVHPGEVRWRRLFQTF